MSLIKSTSLHNKKLSILIGKLTHSPCQLRIIPHLVRFVWGWGGGRGVNQLCLNSLGSEPYINLECTWIKPNLNLHKCRCYFTLMESLYVHFVLITNFYHATISYPNCFHKEFALSPPLQPIKAPHFIVLVHQNCKYV